MNWYYLVGIFAIILILRFILNLQKYYRVEKLYMIYLDYLTNRDIKLIQHTQEIKTLFREAGLKDSTVIHQESLGFGNFSNTSVSIFDNIANTSGDIVSNIQNRFNEAIGVFRKRYRESYNPLFWIDFIIKLPQYFMSFFGVLPEKIAVKIVLMLYWILAILFGFKKFDILTYLLK